MGEPGSDRIIDGDVSKVESVGVEMESEEENSNP